MKVLYIGHYKEQTGWGKAARDYILALDAAGVDVVPRAVKLNNSVPEIPERILELESKSTKDSTHCVQHVLPHHLDFNGRFEKNIALCVYESHNADLSTWPTRINQMDELWVPSTFTQRCFKSMGVNIPIETVPHTFDMSVYQKSYEKIENPELDGNFIFYTIADLNKRKDLLTLIQAFHLAFTANEPVRLLIKTGRYGLTPEACAKIVIDECNNIKASMKLQRRVEDYSQEIIVTDTLSDHDMMRLHATGDCFVTTTHGEAWQLPLFDAVAMGKNCIYPRAMFDYLRGGWEVETNPTHVFGMKDAFPDVSSSYEYWMTSDVDDVVNSMRDCYYGYKGVPKLTMDYGYESIGNLMRAKLEGQEKE